MSLNFRTRCQYVDPNLKRAPTNTSRKSSLEMLEFLEALFHKFLRPVLSGKRPVGDGVADARDTSHLRQEKQSIVSRQSLF